MNKKLILVGKAASGKDYARTKLEQLGFKYAVSYTTRPKRDVEINGKDYFFISREEFLQKIEENYWYEYVEFNGWFYGTSNEQFYTDCNLFIMTPSGISHISKTDRKNCIILYLDTPYNIRLHRLDERLMPGDTVARRITADEIDFENFNDYDISINNVLNFNF